MNRLGKTIEGNLKWLGKNFEDNLVYENNEEKS
jgi:hypothetical protein